MNDPFRCDIIENGTDLFVNFFLTATVGVVCPVHSLIIISIAVSFL